MVLRTIIILSPLLLALCLLPRTALPLDRSRSIGELHHTQWTSKEGAPSQVVALAQTRDGFLWIGTSRGLFRFDGVEFERFAPNGIDLPSANIYALKSTEDGGLWVSFRPSGIGYIKDGEIQVLNGKEQLPRSQIYCFEVDGKGRLWAGTHDGLALRRDDGGWAEIGEDWGFSPQRVRSMFTDSRGEMWVAVDDTIVVLPRDVDRFEETGEKVDSVVTAFTESPDGRVWKGEGLKFVRPVSFGPASGRDFGIKVSHYVGSTLFDRDGTLWFTDGDGIKRVSDPISLDSNILSLADPRLDVFDMADDLSGPILEDREGNIWIGSPQGLNRFRYSYFVANRASARYRNMTLAADPERGIWAGSSLQLPLAHFDGEAVKPVPDVMGISSVFRNESGVLWWGSHSRLLRQAGGEITPFVQPANLEDDWFWEVFPSHGHDYMWVRAGDSGLISFEDGRWGARPPPAGLPERGPSASFTESSSRTWLGYTENRVALVENGVGRMFTSADGIDVDRIRVIRKGSGRIWVGGELGLSVFDGARFNTVKTVQADRFGTVSGIVFSRDGAMWLNEVQGIVRIPKAEIDRIIVDPGHRADFRRFDFEDGLPGAPQMNWTVSTAVEAADGKLWFATDGGLASTDPSNLVSNLLPPSVAIREITVGGQPYDVHQPIELPQGTEDLSIKYTALSLSIPERVQFRYLLEGVDSDWRDAHSRREAFYTNLGPGDYRFRVIASNNDGVWNNEGAALSFRILPKFYQTGWFLVLCAVGLAAIVLLGFRWRLEELKTRMHLQFDERLAERGRIAQDLHDTLLQGFVSASMQLDVAVDSLRHESPEKQRFERVHEMIKRLINDGRETVKGLKSSQVADKEKLGELFYEMREEFDAEHQVGFVVTVGGTKRPLHPITYEEVRHIAQEALFNAFRHSKASNIEVAIEYSPRSFSLFIRDNGRGIEPEVVAAGLEGHWGLTGMRERAERIGARLKVWSTMGRGTEIELIIPSGVAYTDLASGQITRLVKALIGRRGRSTKFNEPVD